MRYLRDRKFWELLTVWGLVLVISFMVSSCGKGGIDEQTQTVRYLSDTITCNQDNICKGRKITCTRQNYYSQTWECVYIIEQVTEE